jgi:UDP-3-O-[3-hydroxymyristoyl] glucosamine N-acyltransferase
MPDPRFYEALGPTMAAELAAAVGGELRSADHGARSILEVAPLGRATSQSVSFFSDRRYLASLKETAAGACFVTAAHVEAAPEGCAAIVVREPQNAYAKAALKLTRARKLDPAAPNVDPSAKLGEDVSIGRGAVIGAGAEIGDRTEIGPGAVIGPGVAIGRDCRVGANAVIGFALIGDRVRIFAGAAIGEEGFGVAQGAEGAVDVPQLGRVILQDDVTVGANSCIDRGAWDDTVVGERTKIDNLVQIAHNVRIGRNCILAAHTGISGSVVVGDGAMFGGRAGVADHLTIGRGARVAAAAGVMKSIPDGEIWCGAPARPLRRFMRETAWLAKQAVRGDGGE